MTSQGRRSRALVLLLGICLLACGSGVACHLIFPYEGRDGGVAGGEAGGSDACLPIEATKVKGKYSGTWSGVYLCPNAAPWNITGTLSIDMKPVSGAKSFQVTGEMKGVADQVYKIKGAVEGTMGCSNLTATMGRIAVTLWVFGVPITYYMKGALKGTFHAPAGSGQGFKDGVWTSAEIGGTCTAKGSWSASAR